MCIAQRLLRHSLVSFSFHSCPLLCYSFMFLLDLVIFLTVSILHTFVLLVALFRLGEPMSRLRSTGRKRASSDDQCGSPLAQPASRPPKSPTRFSSTLDAFDLVPYPQEDTDFSICGAGDSPMTTPTFARIAHISRWEGLSDLSTLTPLSMTTLQPTPGSCVTTERPDTSPAFTSQMTETSFHSASATSAHHHASSRYFYISETLYSDFRSKTRILYIHGFHNGEVLLIFILLLQNLVVTNTRVQASRSAIP